MLQFIVFPVLIVFIMCIVSIGFLTFFVLELILIPMCPRAKGGQIPYLSPQHPPPP